MPLLAPRRSGPRPLRSGRRVRVLAPTTRSGLRSVPSASAPTVPSTLFGPVIFLVALILLTGGYLALEIGADVLHYRIDEERAAIERLDEQLRTTEARIDELRRIAPLLSDRPLDLLINP